jgi:hypothetical protein
VKALLKVPRILQQRTQIDHRVSVVLPELWRKPDLFWGRWRLVQAFWSPTCGAGRL